MLFWLWHYLGIKIDIYQVHNELCILKSSKNSSICTTLKIQDARLLRICTACVQIRISQVHGYSECTVIREVRVAITQIRSRLAMNIKPLKSRLLLHSRETLVEEKSRDFQENVFACLGFG